MFENAREQQQIVSYLNGYSAIAFYDSSKHFQGTETTKIPEVPKT